MFSQLGIKKCAIGRHLNVAESTLRGWLKDLQPPSKVNPPKVVKPAVLQSPSKVDPPKVIDCIDLTNDEVEEDLMKKKEFMKALGLISPEDLLVLEAEKKIRRSRRETVRPARLHDYTRK